MKVKSKYKFIELAEKRVNKTLNDMRLIGNLSNRSNYAYTDEQVDKIFRVLEGQIKDIKALFKKKKVEGKEGFRLND